MSETGVESLSVSTLISTLVPGLLVVLVALKHSLPASQVTDSQVSSPMHAALCLVPLYWVRQEVPGEHVTSVQYLGATHSALDPLTSHWRKSGQSTLSQLAWHLALVRVRLVPRVSSTQTSPVGQSSWSQLVGVTHLVLFLSPLGVVSSTHTFPEQQMMSSQLCPVVVAVIAASSRKSWTQKATVVLVMIET